MGTINRFPYAPPNALLEFENYSADKTPVYDSQLRLLLNTRYEPKIASNKKYLFIGAGRDYTTNSPTITMECIDKNFVHISAPSLMKTNSTEPYCSGTTKDYAVFSGPSIELYDCDSVKVLSKNQELFVTSIHEFAGNILFMGQYEFVGDRIYIPNLAVSMSLELLTTSYVSLPRGCRRSGCTKLGNVLIAAGGYSREITEALPDAFAINEDMTYSDIPMLQTPRLDISACTLNGCALFAGGEAFDNFFECVEVYDSNLTHKTIPSLSAGRTAMVSGVVAQHALFVGGDKMLVDSYDNLFTLTPMNPLQYSSDLSSAHFNGRLFFTLKFGQYDSRLVSFNPSPFDVTLCPGAAYSFDGAPERTVSKFQNISINSPANGYIKYPASRLT